MKVIIIVLIALIFIGFMQHVTGGYFVGVSFLLLTAFAIGKNSK